MDLTAVLGRTIAGKTNRPERLPVTTLGTHTHTCMFYVYVCLVDLTIRFRYAATLLGFLIVEFSRSLIFFGKYSRSLVSIEVGLQMSCSS